MNTMTSDGAESKFELGPQMPEVASREALEFFQRWVDDQSAFDQKSYLADAKLAEGSTFSSYDIKVVLCSLGVPQVVKELSNFFVDSACSEQYAERLEFSKIVLQTACSDTDLHTDPMIVTTATLSLVENASTVVLPDLSVDTPLMGASIRRNANFDDIMKVKNGDVKPKLRYASKIGRVVQPLNGQLIHFSADTYHMGSPVANNSGLVRVLFQGYPKRF